MVKASVMEIYDLQTTVGKGTVLKVHTPTGNNVKRHLFGHFLQYKRYKYVGAKVTVIPASTLPADPLQLSYEAGDTNIDPRDMVNPILWKHYHGETMTTDVLQKNDLENYSVADMAEPYVGGSSISEYEYGQFGTSGVPIDKVYPRALMDNSFRKAGIQQGFSTFVRPFVYNVTSPIQLASFSSSAPATASPNFFMGVTGPSETTYGTGYSVQQNADGLLVGPGQSVYDAGATLTKNNAHADENLTLTTNRLVPFGWQDTLSRSFRGGPQTSSGGISSLEYAKGGDFAVGPNLPNIPMLYILMPPAYKTEFYFRMIIKHYFAFKGFRSCIGVEAFPTAAINGTVPFPVGFYGGPAGASEIAKMAEELDTGGTDTVIVENGTLYEMADGAGGEE